MCNMAQESSLNLAEEEKELQKYVFIGPCSYTSWFLIRLFIEIFQADLAEFPGGKKISKLISKTNPGWQTAIQNRLIWT